MVQRRTFSDIIAQILLWMVMLFVVVVVAYPFLYVINASITPEASAVGKLLLLPRNVTFRTYQILFQNNNILHALWVSIARSLVGGTWMLFVSGMAAYVLAAPNLTGRRFFRTFFVLTMYLSPGIVPRYIFMTKYHLLNTFWIYVLPGLASTFNIILIRTYIESIPRSLTEAVYVDGGNDLQAYWRVIFPVCKPVNSAIFLFGMLSQWNAMVDTRLYAATEKKLYTLQYTLYSIVNSNNNIELLKEGIVSEKYLGSSVKMAVTVITVIPIMLVYPFLQKHFASGIMLGSVKA